MNNYGEEVGLTDVPGERPRTASAATTHERRPECTFRDMLLYAQGDCAISLVMNGIFGFAMLFYTNALGLSPGLAGLAMSLSVLWEAVSEPLMGHISDNTRSRWGRRHLYMLPGGLLMAVCSFLIWDVPRPLLGHEMAIFWYLMVMNLVLRSGLTLFFIPYVALGFEMTQDIQGRSRLQAIRQIMNMAANFFGPALAWALFFHRHGSTPGTAIPANYLHMGAVFAAATVIFVLVCIIFTYRWHQDTRNLVRESAAGGMRSFYRDISGIVRDLDARWVFIFVFAICTGMVMVSSLQIYTYVNFMNFSADQKGIAQGGTMIAMALGALVSMPLARRLDKKGAVVVGGLVSILSNLLLATFFLTGLVPMHAVWNIAGVSVPLALILFVLGQAGYWFGNGIMLPLSVAMIADVSEVHQLKTGIAKDGGYSSVYSLAMRMAIALSMFVAGWCLVFIGYKTALHGPAPVQSSSTIWHLGALTFLSGSLMAAIALVAIQFYRINRGMLQAMRDAVPAVT